MKKFIGLGVIGLVFGLTQTTQAAEVPITGVLDFTAAGYFTSTDAGGGPLDEFGDGLLNMCGDGVTDLAVGPCGGDYEGGPATGFDFADPQVGVVTNVTGSLASAYGIEGFFNPPLGAADLLLAEDIDLNDLAAAPYELLEWTMPIAGVAPLEGIMRFFITSGSETDDSTPGFWDIAGAGYFSFECAPDAIDNGCVSTVANGAWSISNSGNVVITANNEVPAPSALGLLGLGLLAAGFARNRRSRKLVA